MSVPVVPPAASPGVGPLVNPEQAAAIEARGLAFVSAGAGTGKTTVLVERVARAVLERGIAPERILAITYTERAAAELGGRIRARLVAAERPELARALEGAWISTIHGFCSRLLRRFALAAEVDPAFVVLDAQRADDLRRAAYAAAVAELHERHGDALLDLVTAYGPDVLRRLVDGAHEQLRTAGRPIALPEPAAVDLDLVREDLAAAAQALIAVVAAGPVGRWGAENQERALRLLERLDSEHDAEALVRLEEFDAKGREERFDPYNEALRVAELRAREAVYARNRPLLEELLQTFARRYRSRKLAASALDFDDLQLETARLLETRPDVRRTVQGLFAELLVDEFQDTNALQCRIVDAVAGPTTDRFFVGDEHQSIYRFRSADVGVFRARRREAERDPEATVLSLTMNYRSRPEVLGPVNHLFARGFGGFYRPLVAAGSFPEPSPEPAVEFLVTDSTRAREASLEGRPLEARQVAARVAELVRTGRCTPGDVVLLFAAGTDADVFEAALQDEGLETVSATGRRYFDGQQVRDVLAYLALVRNRYDDHALLGVLASPLVGVSNDALVHLRNAAPKRPLFRVFEGTLPETLAADDARLLAAFMQRFERIVALWPRLSLAALIERLVVEHDYDLALLRRSDGDRRYANVRKLVRLARDHEAEHGRSLEGFLTALGERGLAGVREAEAVVAEEGGDAVRLLTVHAAKGLEFPVVVVADAGRGPGGGGEPTAVAADGAVHPKVPDGAGALLPTAGYAEALAADRDADEEERRRVTYVAMTRAADRLIVSGSVAPESLERRSSPMAWLLGLLDVPLDRDVDLAVPGGRVAVRRNPRVDPPPADAEDGDVEVEGQLAFFTDPAEVGPAPPPTAVAAPPPLAPIPPAPPLAPDRLSFSTLSLFERCAYRFAVEHLLGLPPADRPAGIRAATEEGALSATELGTAVHDALEYEGWRDLEATRARASARYPHALPADLERIVRLVTAWPASEPAGRLEDVDAVEREVRFVLREAGVTLSGQMDLVARRGDEVVVVDYKTNRPEGRTAEEMRDHGYTLQEAVYALAALRGGARRVEVTFLFLESGEEATRHYGQDDLAALEERVAAAVRAAVDGPYRPRPSEEACRDCPALDLVCAGPALERLHGPPDA